MRPAKIPQFLRYLIVGVTGYLFEMAVLALATRVFESGTVLAVTLSFWLGLLFSFYFQKVLAFGDHDHSVKVLGRQGMLYGVLVLVNFGFTVGFAWLFEPTLGVYLSRTIALGITTTWNFFIYRSIIFKARANP
ncbi:MAG: GtrA family protein [Aeromicrobium sp.]|nr:MAG: GtrA family protein [Aeromicrobium sp.]